MISRCICVALLLVLCPLLGGQQDPGLPGGGIRIMQLMRSENVLRRYPDALPSLLKMMNEQTNARFDTDPLFISSLTDERLLENPILTSIATSSLTSSFLWKKENPSGFTWSKVVLSILMLESRRLSLGPI